MIVPPNPFERETVDAHRWDHGPMEAAWVSDPTFTEPEALLSQPAFATPAMRTWVWNLSWRSGFARAVQGSHTIEPLVPAVKAWRNPNLVLVPHAGRYTELHAMLASLLPDDDLRRHGLLRPNACFCLWPFSVGGNQDQRNRFALAVEAAFADYIWFRLTGKRGRLGGRNAYRDDSSIRLLIDDSRRWMVALYRVAMHRYERAPGADARYDHMRDLIQRMTVGWDGITSSEWDGNEQIITNSHGRKTRLVHSPAIPQPHLLTYEHDVRFGPGAWMVSGLEDYKPLPKCSLWNPEDPQQREEVIHELLNSPDDGGYLREIADCLRKEQMPEDLADCYSYFREDFERQWNGKRRLKRFKLEFRQTLDDLPAYDGASPMVEPTGETVRGIMAMFDEKEQKIMILCRNGKTMNEIAEKMGYKNHSSISRMINRIERVVYRELDLPRPPRKRR